MATPMSDERLREFKAEYPSDDIRSRCDPEHWRMHELIDEVDRLRARVAALEGVLRSVEWKGPVESVETEDGYRTARLCPRCLGDRLEDHAPDCALDAALRGAGE